MDGNHIAMDGNLGPLCLVSTPSRDSNYQPLWTVFTNHCGQQLRNAMQIRTLDNCGRELPTIMDGS